MLHWVARDGLRTSAIGAGIGLVGTYAAIRLVSRLVIPLPSIDLAIVVFVPLVLAAVLLLACYIPARRATRLDPMVVLRRL